MGGGLEKSSGYTSLERREEQKLSRFLYKNMFWGVKMLVGTSQHPRGEWDGLVGYVGYLM